MVIQSMVSTYTIPITMRTPSSLFRKILCFEKKNTNFFIVLPVVSLFFFASEMCVNSVYYTVQKEGSWS